MANFEPSSDEKREVEYKYRTLEEINELVKNNPKFYRVYIMRANYYARTSKNPDIQKLEFKYHVNYRRYQCIPVIRKKFNQITSILENFDRCEIPNEVRLIQKDYVIMKQIFDEFKKFQDSLRGRSFEEVIDSQPKDCIEFKARAYHVVWIFPNKHELIKNDFTQAVKLCPDDYESMFDRTANSRRMKTGNPLSLDSALVEYNRVIDIEPNFACGYSNRSRVHAEMGNYRNALSDINTGICLLEQLPENLNLGLRSSFYLNRANFLRSSGLGDRQNILKDYKKSIQMNPKNHIALNNNATYYLHVTHQYSEALECLNKAINTKGSGYQNVFARGKCFGMMKEYKLAIIDFSNVIEKAPPRFRRENGYRLRGRCYIGLEMFEEAILDFTKGLELCGQYYFRVLRGKCVKMLIEKIMKM